MFCFFLGGGGNVMPPSLGSYSTPKRNCTLLNYYTWIINLCIKIICLFSFFAEREKVHEVIEYVSILEPLSKTTYSTVVLLTNYTFLNESSSCMFVTVFYFHTATFTVVIKMMMVSIKHWWNDLQGKPKFPWKKSAPMSLYPWWVWYELSWTWIWGSIVRNHDYPWLKYGSVTSILLSLEASYTAWVRLKSSII
jgi:hypothetical protein